MFFREGGGTPEGPKNWGLRAEGARLTNIFLIFEGICALKRCSERHFSFSIFLFSKHFLFHGDFGSTPLPPSPKRGSTKEDVRKGKGYYSNKRKISAKRDKDKKIFSFSKNLLNRNAIKR